MRQKPILLCLVEPVDFVNEKQGTAALSAAVLGLFEHFAQFRHAGKNRTDLDEMQIGFVSQQSGNGGLAHAGRAPEDQRREAAGGKHHAERGFGAKHLILSDDISETTRSEPVGQGARARVGTRRVACIKEIRHRSDPEPQRHAPATTLHLKGQGRLGALQRLGGTCTIRCGATIDGPQDIAGA